MKNNKLTIEEQIMLKRLSKPKYTFKDIENHFLAKGINPFAPWMEEDHKRCEKILNEK